MTTLQISIFGISCLADPRLDGLGTPIDGFKKRVLLPTDTISDASHPPHIPYVEIAVGDFYTNPDTISGLTREYTRDGGTYRRFELYGQRLWIDDIDTTQDWWVSPLFDYRVAKMKLVLPTLDPNPNYRCFDQVPPKELVSGYFDINNYGRLTVGKIDPQYTLFNPTKSWPRRRLAVSAVLELAVTSALPQFRIEYFGETPGGGTNVVRLKQDAAGISIGNLPLSDLTGSPSTDDPSHDFQMFYKLAYQEPSNPPLPLRQHGIDVACSPTGWP
jgi:hypothetical protein